MLFFGNGGSFRLTTVFRGHADSRTASVAVGWSFGEGLSREASAKCARMRMPPFRLRGENEMDGRFQKCETIYLFPKMEAD